VVLHRELPYSPKQVQIILKPATHLRGRDLIAAHHPVSANLLCILASGVPNEKITKPCKKILARTPQGAVFCELNERITNRSLCTTQQGLYFVGKICSQDETLLRF
jgi:hypothetical protein